MRPLPFRRVTWLDRLRIRQCVGSATLPCGCGTGRYLSYSDELIEIIDQHASACGNPRHIVDMVVAPDPRPPSEPHSTVDDAATRATRSAVARSRPH